MYEKTDSDPNLTKHMAQQEYTWEADTTHAMIIPKNQTLI